MDTLIVDEEFEHLLPPLSDEEFKNLERDIIENGVREFIVVWAGTGIICDGYNRYHICKEHDIGFGVFEKQFSSRAEAANWIVKNQKTRRNLSKGQEADVGIRLYRIQFEEEVRLKKIEDGKRTGALAHKKKSREGSAEFGGTLTATPISTSASESTTNQSESEDDTSLIVDEMSEPSRTAQQESEYEADVLIEVVHTPDKTKKKAEKNREAETAHRIAKKTGVGVSTVKQVMAVHKSGEQDLIDGIQTGGLSANKAYTMMRDRERKAVSANIEKGEAVLHVASGAGVTETCDLLITEVPEGVGPDGWIYTALSGVKRDGHAYVFVDPSPESLMSYLGASIPLNVELTQVLVWSFDYVLGNNDWSRYKPSWKAILFFRGVDAHDLRFPHIKERNAVHSVEAEGGNLGDREYELRMPITLAKRLISQSTNEDDMVFDPFANRGTFLLAAKDLGRNAIGYEPDESLANEAFGRGIERDYVKPTEC